MLRFLFVYVLLILADQGLTAQESSISFLLVEQVSKLPVANAHVFLASSTYGSITNQEGRCRLVYPSSLKGKVVITHINYETLVFDQSEFSIQASTDTIYIRKNGIDLSDVTVTAKRDKKWRRNLLKFSEALLGKSLEAREAEILNPEVLRFSYKDEKLSATAVDVLKIRNSFLGYSIDFYLKELSISEDGSKIYNGQAKFTSFKEKNLSKRILQNRKDVFATSQRHFFLTLINEDKIEQRYKFRMANYENGYFSTLMIPRPEQLLQWHEASNTYRLYFSSFLEIENLQRKQISFSETRINSAGLESARFNTDATSKTEIKKTIVSQIFKVSPFLEISKNGNVINVDDVKEYGFWAGQRLAHTLPLNYQQNEFLAVIDTSTKITAKSNRELEKYSWSRLQPLFFNDTLEQEKVIRALYTSWEDQLTVPLLDLLLMTQNDALANQITNLLQEKKGASVIPNYYEGMRSLWKFDPIYADDYLDFKASLYKYIDPKFEKYFAKRQSNLKIRADEIIWGGVAQDGIPPLRHPKLLSAPKAQYLDDKDVVFGVSINGVQRAYPKRILGWHEMVNDTLGKASIAGVYCTLCGTMIVYKQQHEGIIHELGTSGFLYRSNKLMYDKASQSLWSTIEGTPVLGPLVEENIELELFPVVTTTWGAWKTIHPETTVLDIDTGFDRDYSEGAAYRDYYSNDQLMFPVPLLDNRLTNKSEILGIPPNRNSEDAIAISYSFLRKNKIHHFELNKQNYLALTSDSGSRIYKSEEVLFKKLKDNQLEDRSGIHWKITEDKLTNESGESLPRIKTHSSFWFAWHNTYPNTKLLY